MEKIIEDLCIKYNLPRPIMEKIVKDQFRFTASIMTKGEFKPVRLPYLGVFGVKPGRREKLNEKVNSI